MNAKDTTLPLFNHECPVLERADQEIGGLPAAACADSPLLALHEDHVHLVGGAAHRGLPIEAARDWLVAHKTDEAALDPVLLLFHNRNVVVDKVALQKGETDPRRLFTVRHADAMLARDGDGAAIIPLDQLAVGRIYGFHHDQKHEPEHRSGIRGGAHSRAAIAALDHFLVTVMGLQPNHAVLKARFGNPKNLTKE